MKKINKKELRIIFAGTPDFAKTSLEFLNKNNYNIVCTITKENKPSGRGQQEQISQVGAYAIEQKIEVFQPQKMDEKAVEKIKLLKPDLMIVVAYGHIIPQKILDIPTFGCWNIHASVLPKYRGAAPIHRAILNGELETGITIMQMDKGLDTGDMLLIKKCKIEENDTTLSLHDKLANISCEALENSLQNLEDNNIVKTKQNNKLSTYAKKILKEESWIDWNEDIEKIDKQIKGLNPFPIAKTKIGEKNIKIFFSHIENGNIYPKNEVGTILKIDKKGMYVKCTNGTLLVTQLQFANKNKVSGADILNGYSDILVLKTKLTR
jgi:methionyl-tRNA formyltransferase